MSEQLSGDARLHESTATYTIVQESLLIDGDFRQPSVAYLRAVNALPERQLQVRETVLYALELCGVLRQRGELEGDIRILKDELDDLSTAWQQQFLDSEQEHSERLRLTAELARVESDISYNDQLLQRIQSAQILDKSHNQEAKDDIRLMVSTLSLNGVPCFLEIDAIEASVRDNKPVLDREVTSESRRVLEMLVLSDINQVSRKKEPVLHKSLNGSAA